MPNNGNKQHLHKAVQELTQHLRTYLVMGFDTDGQILLATDGTRKEMTILFLKLLWVQPMFIEVMADALELSQELDIFEPSPYGAH